MNQESEAERDLRLSSTTRGLIIAVLIGLYAYVTSQPGATFTVTLLIAAGLQGAVVLLRRFVPPSAMPQVLNLFELLVDAGTVLLFALGVFGGILSQGYDF